MKLDCPLLIKTPADMIAVVPYLLGFHPADSIVVIGTQGGRITFGARHDLPPPDSADLAYIGDLVAAQHVDAVVVIGYGQAGRVTPAALRLENELRLAGVRVQEVLRVTGGRWWSYSRAEDYLLAEGSPCRPSDGELAAEATYRGHVALPNRRALVAQVAPATGADRAAFTEATDRARARLTTLAAEDERAFRGGRWLRRAGRQAVRDAENRARAGRPLLLDDLAWLTVLLTVPAVADYATDRTTDHPWRIRLWTEVLRGAEPDLVPMPACLLGLSAWRDGQGALARVAIDRALQADPMHDLSCTLDRLLACGIAPEAVEWPVALGPSAPAPPVHSDDPVQLTDYAPAVLPPDGLLIPDYLPVDDLHPGGEPSGNGLPSHAGPGLLSADVLAPDLLRSGAEAEWPRLNPGAPALNRAERRAARKRPADRMPDRPVRGKRPTRRRA